jgi:hypothetical protein
MNLDDATFKFLFMTWRNSLPSGHESLIEGIEPGQR